MKHAIASVPIADRNVPAARQPVALGLAQARHALLPREIERVVRVVLDVADGLVTPGAVAGGVMQFIILVDCGGGSGGSRHGRWQELFRRAVPLLSPEAEPRPPRALLWLLMRRTLEKSAGIGKLRQAGAKPLQAIAQSTVRVEAG